MTHQPALFPDDQPKCGRCNGTGRVRDREGENQDCPACLGSGFRYDPQTAPFPDNY